MNLPALEVLEAWFDLVTLLQAPSIGNTLPSQKLVLASQMTRLLEHHKDHLWTWPYLADIPPVFVNTADFDPSLSPIHERHQAAPEELQNRM